MTDTHIDKDYKKAQKTRHDCLWRTTIKKLFN